MPQLAVQKALDHVAEQSDASEPLVVLSDENRNRPVRVKDVAPEVIRQAQRQLARETQIRVGKHNVTIVLNRETVKPLPELL